MSAPRISLVVVPRERFSAALRSLDSLLAATPEPFELVYVDAGSPPPIRRAIAARIASRPDSRLLRVNGYLPPNQARNLGFRASTGDYVAFTDNDVVFSPDWLPPLVQAAEATGAVAVGPLICEREPVHTLLHDAGTMVTITEGPAGRQFEQRFLFPEYKWHQKPLAELQANLRRFECDVVELHCVLVRRSALEALGGLDEALLSMWEHTDLCLSLKRAGGTVWVEPSSVVTFLRPPPIRPMDWPYFFLRWSDDWARRSDERLAHNWGRHTPGGLPWVQSYRHKAWGATVPRLEKWLGYRVTHRLVNGVEANLLQRGMRRLAGSVAAR